MKIEKILKKVIPNTNCYVVKVKTMEGDADDYHSFELMPEDEDELRNMILHLEVTLRCYPNGRGGYDTYVGKYSTKYFGELHYYEGMEDEIESYEVLYYDENGTTYDVEITPDEDMINEIKNPELSAEEKDEMSYPSPDKIEVERVIKNSNSKRDYHDDDSDEDWADFDSEDEE